MKDFITIAVPFMLAAVLVEMFWARRKRLRIYRTPDAIASFATGIVDQVAAAALPWIAGAALYLWVWKHAAIFHMRAASPWTLLAAFIGADFFYYWWHRASHRMSVLWAAHVVHHQSEDYNLSTALRQNPITTITAVPFYLPLAILGIPFGSFVAMKSLMILYQFWTQTELIPKLGPLELVLNTPSHHRVHHAINPQYVDRNYAGAFIVWDRMFGTFAQEEIHPTYGTLKPLHSFDPMWAFVHPWIGLFKAMQGLNLRDRIRVALMPPGWSPQQPDGPNVEALFQDVRRFDPPLSRRKARLGLMAFFLTLAASRVGLEVLFPLEGAAGKLVTAGVLVLGVAGLGRVIR